MAKKKHYTQEFKESAVKLISEQGYKVSEAARNLGVNANVLGRWKRDADGDGGHEVNNGEGIAGRVGPSQKRKSAVEAGA